jgi:hypothetical protein
MVLPFPEEHKAVILEVTDEIPPLDGHLDLGGDLFEKGAAYGDLFLLLAMRQDHLPESILKHGPAVLEGFSLGHDLGPLDELAHIA